MFTIVLSGSASRTDNSTGLFPTMLKGRTLAFDYDRLCEVNGPRDCYIMVSKVKVHFDSWECNQMYLSEWRRTTLTKVVTDNPRKLKIEYLELLFDKLTKIQRALPTILAKAEDSLCVQVLSACRGVPGCTTARRRSTSGVRS
jgi:hypothetical protein